MRSEWQSVGRWVSVTSEREYMNETNCNGHTKFDGSYWVNDARGIPLARVCPKCKTAKLAKFRPGVLLNSNYWTDEEIEENY